MTRRASWTPPLVLPRLSMPYGSLQPGMGSPLPTVGAGDRNILRRIRGMASSRWYIPYICGGLLEMISEANLAHIMRLVPLVGVLFCLVTCGTEPEPAGVPVEGLDVRSVTGVETFPQPLSSLVGADLLSDGRLAVADGREVQVAVIDFEDGEFVPIGRRGAGGPGEYASLQGLSVLPADTILVVERGRWQLFTPAGLSVGVLRPSWIGLVPGSPRADGRSRLCVAGALSSDALGQAREEDAIACWDRPSDRLDTLAYRRLPPQQLIELDRPGSRFAFQQPFGAQDLWTPMQSGGVAIARAAEGQVHVIPDQDDSSPRSGPRLLIDPVPLDAREAELPPNYPVEWELPSHKPIFGQGRMFVSAEGTVWVPLSPAFQARTRAYVVYRDDGVPLYSVTVPGDWRLIGVGRDWGFAYVIDGETGWFTILRFRLTTQRRG